MRWPSKHRHCHCCRSSARRRVGATRDFDGGFATSFGRHLHGLSRSGDTTRTRRTARKDGLHQPLPSEPHNCGSEYDSDNSKYAFVSHLWRFHLAALPRPPVSNLPPSLGARTPKSKSMGTGEITTKLCRLQPAIPLRTGTCAADVPSIARRQEAKKRQQLRKWPGRAADGR
jgi:hypothetical protein